MDQRLVGEALALRARHEAFQPLHRVVFHVAVVQPEGEFIDVTAQMLLAGVMVDADQAALENREHALDVVGRNAVADVFAGAVVDGLVIEEQPTKAVRFLVAFAPTYR